MHELAVLALALAAVPAWVEKSNHNAQTLIDIEARYNPESAGHFGVSGLDERIRISARRTTSGDTARLAARRRA